MAAVQRKRFKLDDEELLNAEESQIGLMDKFVELLERLDHQIDQVNNLYNIYLSGAEEHPPLYQRNNVDRIHNTLWLMKKPTTHLKYRFETVHMKYATYRDRWDKRLRDVEAGRIVRKLKGKKKKYVA